MRVLTALTVIYAVVASATATFAQDVDWQKVDDAIGRKPAVVAGDVHRYGFPRTDLSVTLDGVTIKPALALGGWVAFKPMGSEVMAMGDLVLLETEIKPVMTKMIENGLDITAVHNHLLRANPATFYMHVGGHGDPVKLATAIKAALAESKTPLTPPAPASAPPAIDLDTAQLDQIIGAKGQPNGGVYQFGVPRRDPVTQAGMTLSPVGPLGVATAIGFQPTGGGNAAITGDFVMIASEVNPVIKALRSGGIEVTALHSHMLDEQPRLSSCISGPTTMPSSSPRRCAPPWMKWQTSRTHFESIAPALGGRVRDPTLDRSAFVTDTAAAKRCPRRLCGGDRDHPRRLHPARPHRHRRLADCPDRRRFARGPVPLEDSQCAADRLGDAQMAAKRQPRRRAKLLI